MNWRPLTTLLISLLANVAFSGQMLKNPDFEGGEEKGRAAGWNYGAKSEVGYGYGRNFTRGLKYSGDGGAYDWVFQRVPVEAGTYYRFEAWVKTENISEGKGVFLAVSCFNKNGKWCETSTTPGVVATSGGWRMLSVDVMTPKSSVYAEVSIRVANGERGVFFADDFSFSRVERPPVKFLACDAYRNTAKTGKVTFRLVSNFTDGEIVANGWSGRIRLPDVSSTSYFVQRPAPAFTNGVSTFTVDIDKMPFGEFPVSFVMVDGDGRTVASQTVLLDHPKEEPVRKVRIDSAGRTIVNGEPFFPFGMYMDDFSGSRAEKYAKGPFNCLLPYATLTRKQMDFAHAKGLKVVYSLKNIYRGYMFQPFPMRDEDDEMAHVAAKVAALKDHPALLAWYVQDEMGPGMAGRLRARNRLIGRIDPDHPTVGCFCRPEAAVEYMDTSDVLGTDPYPIRVGMSHTAISRVASETVGVRKACFGMRPLWQVVQAFDQSYIYKEKSKIRHPTGDEMLNMCLQCVVAGANGVFLWSYHHLGQNALGHRPDDFERYWSEACKAGEVFRKMIPVFLSEDATHLVSGAKDTLPVRAWRYRGVLWLLAVNASHTPVKTSISVADKTIMLDMPPLGYSLRKAE